MSTDGGAASAAGIRGRRALRLAIGTAICLATSFGLGWAIPMVAPVMGAFVLASFDRPLPARAGVGLALVAMLATGSGLLIVPFLRHYPFSGVLMTGLGLFLAFRHGLRGGNSLVGTLLAVGLTMISVAGTADIGLAVTVIAALVKGLLLAVAVLALCYWLIPEPAKRPAAPRGPAFSVHDANWMALRSALVVMPTVLLALGDPAAYMPILMKAVSLGRQSCTMARGAALELIGSTLLGGLLAILFWWALGLFVHLWMFFLWMLLFALLLARKLFAGPPARLSPGFWLNTLVTLIILLGQSVEDSAAGKDVYHAFAVRMGLFIGVTLYACLVLRLLDQRRRDSHAVRPTT
ncbi:DUF2955 domain-containing protein [Cupriavidus pinatubonensis]|uniref:DUF2955 domain-containing protein n=1 Tax=Cupriavidus pinatubonensis TaxID=248026 RepID=UPI001C72BC9B|nr:DUF2955 domain-containing protein [Cupriavidus pinatubonensis]QYY33269.1 DUF2955 domain-containing protein [Cupriavidus pinatubonensis]